MRSGGVVVVVTESDRPPRRRLNPDDRRDELIAATVALIARVGYDATSVAAVAREAGASKGLMWRYFADRDDLMVQTARRTLTRLRGAVVADVDMSRPVPEVIRRAIRRAAALPATHSAELTALREIAVNLRDDDGSLRLGAEEYGETHAGQTALFRRGQQEGSLRRGPDPAAMAVTYQGVIEAMLAYLALHPQVDPGRYADALADLVLHGFAAPTS